MAERGDAPLLEAQFMFSCSRPHRFPADPMPRPPSAVTFSQSVSSTSVSATTQDRPLSVVKLGGVGKATRLKITNIIRRLCQSGQSGRKGEISLSFLYGISNESSPGSFPDGQCSIEQSGPKYCASCVWPCPRPTFCGAISQAMCISER